MTRAEEVIGSLQSDCMWACGGRYVATDDALSCYTAALGAAAPGDDSFYAWICDQCGSIVFRDSHGRPAE